MTEPGSPHKTCPHCGFSEKEFIAVLRLGCPNCYEVFMPELTTFLLRLHPGMSHVGKSPKAFQTETQRLELEMKEIQSLLATNLPPEQSDDLLDRWRELSRKLEAQARNPRQSP